MNSEMVNTNYSEEPETREREVEVEVNSEETKLLPSQKISTASSATNPEWQKYGEQIAAFLQNLPSYIGSFFAENKGLLGVFGLFFGALIAVKLTLALLDAINDVPLVAPTFELIGLVYTGWFIYRYLLRASNRQELSEEVESLKQQVFGAKS